HAGPRRGAAAGNRRATGGGRGPWTTNRPASYRRPGARGARRSGRTRRLLFRRRGFVAVSSPIRIYTTQLVCGAGFSAARVHDRGFSLIGPAVRIGSGTAKYEACPVNGAQG